jgi:hypothetical protein
MIAHCKATIIDGKRGESSMGGKQSKIAKMSQMFEGPQKDL